jgi:ribose 5-phosphate isomerase B
MTIALASDHAGLPLKQVVAQLLDEMKIPYKDYGTYTEERCNYPEYGYKAAVAVASGECEKGIICCGTGVGISLSANKVKGIRCVVCSEPYSALLSRQHNDTNMLAMGSRVVGSELAKMIVKEWLAGEFEGGRHAHRVGQIMEIDETRKLAVVDSQEGI